MTQDRKDKECDPNYLGTIFNGLKAALRGVYGTDMHIVMQEERDHAAEAIIRMAEEADHIKNVRYPVSMSVDQVFEAMVKDLET